MVIKFYFFFCYLIEGRNVGRKQNILLKGGTLKCADLLMFQAFYFSRQASGRGKTMRRSISMKTKFLPAQLFFLSKDNKINNYYFRKVFLSFCFSVYLIKAIYSD